MRGADDGALRTCDVAQGVGVDCGLRRARLSQHVQVRPAAPAPRTDDRGADLRQQRHIGRPRRVHGPARQAHPPQRPQRVTQANKCQLISIFGARSSASQLFQTFFDGLYLMRMLIKWIPIDSSRRALHFLYLVRNARTKRSDAT